MDTHEDTLENVGRLGGILKAAALAIPARNGTLVLYVNCIYDSETRHETAANRLMAFRRDTCRVLSLVRDRLRDGCNNICISLYASDRSKEGPRLYRLVVPRDKLAKITVLPNDALVPPYEGEYSYVESIQALIQKGGGRGLG